ncbi:MAG TPA: integrase family protein [Steroidobacteraceae bacterium]|nr:integrase family protein [Steroidobacteraceae bacterium]
MKAVNFSVERIAKFECEEGKRQTFFRDGKTPGLGLRVTAAGAKSYIFETRLHSKTIRITIGDIRTWTIASAQKEATEFKTLTDKGLDPRKLKKEKKAAEETARLKVEGDAILIGEAWKVYVTQRANRWGTKYRAQHAALSQLGGEPKKKGGGPKLTKPGVLAPLMQVRLKDMTATILTALIKDEVLRRRGMAREAFLLFRTFWRWCAKREEYKFIIDAMIINDEDLRAEVPKKKNKRFDVLERSHLRPWFAAVRKLENPVLRAFLQTLILTGARLDEMASLQWKDVDFKFKSMWIKDKVEEGGRKIPLTPYVCSLLNALPRKNQWVFSSDKSVSGRIHEPRKAHVRALKAAGLNHVSIHGLRRTFASLAQWLDFPAGVIAQLMGHKPKATAEQHYINRPLDLLAVWQDKYEAWILQQAGVRFGTKKSRKKAPKSRAPVRHLRLVSSR